MAGVFEAAEADADGVGAALWAGPEDEPGDVLVDEVDVALKTKKKPPPTARAKTARTGKSNEEPVLGGTGTAFNAGAARALEASADWVAAFLEAFSVVAKAWVGSSEERLAAL